MPITTPPFLQHARTWLWPEIRRVGAPISPEVRAVARQYEAHPYPAIPVVATPVLGDASPLIRDHAARILVAGCGAFEPVVVARAHPGAKVVAVDLSGSSLRRARTRALLAGVLPRMRFVQADLHQDLSRELGVFDYIVCTGVVHHSNEAGLLLARLASLLATGGALRLMTYAAHSRVWIRELQRFFAEAGLTRDLPPRELAARVRARIALLEPAHPLRASFEQYSDARTRAGLIDGFFHACEKPIPVRALRGMVERSGLALLGFGHAEHSRPPAFQAALAAAGAPASVLARFTGLDAWEQLEVIDDCAELVVNPVFWLTRAETHSAARQTATLAPRPAAPTSAMRGTDALTTPDVPIPPRVRAELVAGLKRALTLLEAGPDAIPALTRALEPRADRAGRELPWLSAGDWLRDLASRGMSSDEIYARILA